MAIFTPQATGNTSPFTSPPVTLSPGDLTVVATLAASSSSSVVFNVRARQFSAAQPIMNYSAALNGASASGATLMESSDGGTTFVAAGAALDLHATPAGQIAVIPGKLYRFDFGTITGGTGVTLTLGIT